MVAMCSSRSWGGSASSTAVTPQRAQTMTPNQSRTFPCEVFSPCHNKRFLLDLSQPTPLANYTPSPAHVRERILTAEPKDLLYRPVGVVGYSSMRGASRQICARNSAESQPMRVRLCEMQQPRCTRTAGRISKSRLMRGWYHSSFRAPKLK
eukprot:scaffold139469_cov289-Phaeocystis_antarctica.AAC.3